jgi:hypothetical protein
MRYLTTDVAHFVSSSPYLAIAKPPGAAWFLQKHVEAAEECSVALRAYPGVRIEPLEFLYTCLQSLGALDQPFFEALVLDHTWRGAVWGSFLALLDPRPGFLDALRKAGPQCPHNEWLIGGAISTIEGRAPAPESEVVAALAERYRRVLQGVPRPVVRLRPAPTDAQIAEMRRESRQIGLVYERLGATAALESMRGTLVAYYTQSHERWRRSQVVPTA